MTTISVVKRDGTREPYDANKINLALVKASEGLEDQIAKVVEVASQLQLTLFDGITSEQLDEAVIQTALQNVKDDPDYDKIAARLLLKTLYKNILGDYDTPEELKKLHAKSFPQYLKDGVKDGLLDKRLGDGRFDIAKLAKSLDPTKDDLSKFLGVIQTKTATHFAREVASLLRFLSIHICVLLWACPLTPKTQLLRHSTSTST